MVQHRSPDYRRQYERCNLKILPDELLRGLRAALEMGYDPQELADRIGPLIDLMAEDLRRQPEEADAAEEPYPFAAMETA